MRTRVIAHPSLPSPRPSTDGTPMSHPLPVLRRVSSPRGEARCDRGRVTLGAPEESAPVDAAQKCRVFFLSLALTAVPAAYRALRAEQRRGDAARIAGVPGAGQSSKSPGTADPRSTAADAG